ncbi:TfoX/Sxy family protein [Marinobacter sp. R17]|uniref:TfoX/Sxy family protein n=1 Tax=Marinobacter sp. R17 TaxID=2484250 RepID=UPI001CC1F9AD|nr:TfoX/Sxy family protein [Marinobacter sp. R17]
MVKDAKIEFATFVVDQLQGVGPVQAKRMFGGYGLFLGDIMFALISGQTLYLKFDAQSEPAFVARGLEPFTIPRQGKRIAMSYRQAPEEVFEDPEQMMAWGNEAYAAALRASQSGKR